MQQNLGSVNNIGITHSKVDRSEVVDVKIIKHLGYAFVHNYKPYCRIPIK